MNVDKLIKEGYSGDEIEMLALLMERAKTCLHRPVIVGNRLAVKLDFCQDCGSHIEKNPGEPDVVYRITRLPDGTEVGYTSDF